MIEAICQWDVEGFLAGVFPKQTLYICFSGTGEVVELHGLEGTGKQLLFKLRVLLRDL